MEHGGKTRGGNAGTHGSRAVLFGVLYPYVGHMGAVVCVILFWGWLG